MPEPFSKNVHWAERNSYDPFHWAFTTIDAEHRLVHEGLMFSLNDVTTGVANNSSLDVLFRVAESSFPHIRVLKWIAEDADASGFVYEAPTTSDDGTQLTNIVNRNRNSSETANSTLFVGPTVSDVGIELAHFYFPDQGGLFGQTGVFGDDPGEEWVFKPNTNYLFRLTNQSGSAITVGTQIIWYELNGYGR